MSKYKYINIVCSYMIVFTVVNMKDVLKLVRY